MSKENEIRWLEEPEEHDYPAAGSYLSLIYDSEISDALHSVPAFADSIHG